MPTIVVLVPLLLIGISETSGDTPSANNVLTNVKSTLIGTTVVDDLAARINTLLKEELEREFGQLIDQITSDETEIWGRVIALDYELPTGKRLDDTWGDKVVIALARLDITAEYDGGEVRAEQQTIAGKQASSIQFTTQRTIEDPDVIGFVAMFPRSHTTD